MGKFKGKYPANWPAITLRVKTEAGWRCIRCGHEAESPGFEGSKPCDRFCDLERHPEFHELPTDKMREEMKAYLADDPDGTPSLAQIRLLNPRQRVLTVHHFDGDKSNNHWWNLMALCQVCHLVIQAKVIPERPWMFEHSEWIRPYVAAYYAFTMLGHSIPREAAEDPRLQPALLDLATAPDPEEIGKRFDQLYRMKAYAKDQS